MENKPEGYFDETYELIKKYTDDRLLLVKIQTAKKTAKITSKIIFIFIASTLLFFVMLFLGFMLAHYFAERMNSTMYGFGIVAGIYFFLFILFIIAYKSYFGTKVMNMITTVFFENDPYNTDDDDEY